MHPHEIALVNAFIAPNRRHRWLGSLASAKRRSKFLDKLNHCRDIDERFAQMIPSNSRIEAILREHGAPTTCYVLSDMESLDGKEMALSEAISESELGGWGTIISCVPGRLAYYYDEQGERRMLLMRETK